MWLTLGWLMLGKGQLLPQIPPKTQQPAIVAPTGAVKGDVVQFHFLVKDMTGRTIADSDARGLPMTIRLGDPGNDPLLETVAFGVKKGDLKTETVNIEDVYPSPAMRTLVPKKGSLVVRLTILSVRPGATVQGR